MVVPRFTMHTEDREGLKNQICCQRQYPHKHSRRMYDTVLNGIPLDPNVWESNHCTAADSGRKLVLRPALPGAHDQLLVFTFGPVNPLEPVSAFRIEAKKRGTPLTFDGAGLPTLAIQVFGKSGAVARLRCTLEIDGSPVMKASERFQVLRKVGDPVRAETGDRVRRAKGEFRVPVKRNRRRKPLVNEEELYGRSPDLSFEPHAAELPSYDISGPMTSFKMEASPLLEQSFLPSLDPSLPSPASYLSCGLYGSGYLLPSPACVPMACPQASPAHEYICRVSGPNCNAADAQSNPPDWSDGPFIMSGARAKPTYDFSDINELNDDAPAPWMYPMVSNYACDP